MNNLWNYGILPWKHPANWLKNIKQYFKNFKYMRQRIKRGWADCDAWGMNDFILIEMKEMLEYLAKYSHGFPLKYASYSDEEGARLWMQELIALAERVNNINGYNDDFTLETIKDYDDYRSKTFAMLSDVWDDLWD